MNTTYGLHLVFVRFLIRLVILQRDAERWEERSENVERRGAKYHLGVPVDAPDVHSAEDWRSNELYRQIAEYRQGGEGLSGRARGAEGQGE